MSLDRTITCKTCGKEFVFTAKEQEFFAKKGFSNDPSKCRDCREKARKEKNERQSTATCTSCGKSEIVSFTVMHPEHLLCDNCFETLRPKMPEPPPEEPTSEQGTIEIAQLDG